MCVGSTPSHDVFDHTNIHGYHNIWKNDVKWRGIPRIATGLELATYIWKNYITDLEIKPFGFESKIEDLDHYLFFKFKCT